MKRMMLQVTILYWKAKLGLGQHGPMNEILIWNMVQLQDQSLHVFLWLHYETQLYSFHFSVPTGLSLAVELQSFRLIAQSTPSQ